MRWLVLFFSFFTCFVVVGLGASGARAQDAPATDPPTEDASPATEAPPTGQEASSSPTPAEAPSTAAPSSSPAAAGGAAAPIVVNVNAAGDEDEEEEDETPPEQNPIDPHELEGESYHHVGVFARGIFMPAAIQNIFVWGGAEALNAGVGAFYNYRRDGLNIQVEVWRAGFYGSGFFRGLDESDLEVEWLESELHVWFGSLVLMWSIPVASFLAIEIGVGLGFGGVFGGLYRTEAYRDGATGRFVPCNGEGDPDATYCDASAQNPPAVGSYHRAEGTSEPYNFSGGVPPLWLWVDLPRVAIRIKPIRQLQIRVEGGFAAYAIYFGLSTAVGF